MTALALWLWARLSGPLGALWRLARRYPLAVALIASLCLCGWLYRGKEQALGDLAAMKAASRQAAKGQATVNHEPARKAAAIAENSNAEAPGYYRSVRDAAAAHAVRVRAPASSPIPAGVPGADSALESLHGPDAAADLVCRPAVEDRQIIDAASRGAEMHQEALDLIAEGVAVKAGE